MAQAQEEEWQLKYWLMLDSKLQLLRRALILILQIQVNKRNLNSHMNHLEEALEAEDPLENSTWPMADGKSKENPTTKLETHSLIGFVLECLEEEQITGVVFHFVLALEILKVKIEMAWETIGR